MKLNNNGLAETSAVASTVPVLLRTVWHPEGERCVPAVLSLDDGTVYPSPAQSPTCNSGEVIREEVEVFSNTFGVEAVEGIYRLTRPQWIQAVSVGARFSKYVVLVECHRTGEDMLFLGRSRLSTSQREGAVRYDSRATALLAIGEYRETINPNAYMVAVPESELLESVALRRCFLALANQGDNRDYRNDLVAA